MVRVRETDVRSRVLGEVREELKSRAPADGYRPYDATRLSPDVKKAFTAVANGKPDDAKVEIDAVVGAYASRMKKTIGEANKVGPAFLTEKEAKAVGEPMLRARVMASRSELARGKKSLSDEAILRSAARFIADHSAPINTSSNAIDVFFPAFDSGNGADWDEHQAGIGGDLIKDGEKAKLILRIIGAGTNDEIQARLATFDPAKEYLIIVRDSQDETSWYPAAIDKSSGKARGFDTSHNEVDFPYMFDSVEAFESVWGPGSAQGVEDDLEYAFSEKLQALMDKEGKSIPISKMNPPEIDKAKLTDVAAKKLQTWFAEAASIPASFDLSQNERNTLEAIRAAIHDGQTITIGESYGDPILMMPRKFEGAAEPDYWVGWAVSELFKQIPEMKRFYNVDAKAASES
jgi:hypothetical protein